MPKVWFVGLFQVFANGVTYTSSNEHVNTTNAMLYLVQYHAIQAVHSLVPLLLSVTIG